MNVSTKQSYDIDLNDILVKKIFSKEVDREVYLFLKNISNKIVYGKNGVVFKISKLGLNEDKSKLFSIKLLNLVLEHLKGEGVVPKDTSLEIDNEQDTYIGDERTNLRTLLPHHDGGHCSYLTPSKNIIKSWDPKKRIFSNNNFFTTHKHKIIQGIFITNPGEGRSTTTYYDWLEIIKDSFNYQNRREYKSILELQEWLGNNISYSLENQSIHMSGYLNIGSALGIKNLMYQSLALNHSDEVVSDEAIAKFPDLAEVSKTCICTQCTTNSLKLLCKIIHLTLGLTYPEFRKKYEKQVESEKFDLIVGNNLSTLHGGLDGGSQRVILPLCYVIEDTESVEYETFLEKLWNR